MSKSKALIAAEAKIAALEARIAVATEVYRNQKARMALGSNPHGAWAPCYLNRSI